MIHKCVDVNECHGMAVEFMSKFKTAVFACAAGALISGCASAQAGPIKPKPTVHQNGTIASMKLVHVQGQNPDLKVYKMFYWSEGEKVEAYFSEPANAGPNDYPLRVVCHGGYDIPWAKTHASSPEKITDVAGVGSDNQVNADVIAPQYRGYAESQGTVQGLSGDTTDAENAIKAADSLKVVNNQCILLIGVSMGGGVVLQIASDPTYSNDVQAVVAVSPFTGWNNVMQWSVKNETNPIAGHYTNDAASGYGPYNPHSRAYIENSVDVSKIDVPVLLEQGTGDKVVPWQSVEMLYDKMKKDGETAKLILYPGGDHGLTGKYSNQSYKDQEAWFNEF